MRSGVYPQQGLVGAALAAALAAKRPLAAVHDGVVAQDVRAAGEPLLADLAGVEGLLPLGQVGLEVLLQPASAHDLVALGALRLVVVRGRGRVGGRLRLFWGVWSFRRDDL